MTGKRKADQAARALSEKEEVFCYYYMEFRSIGAAYSKAFGELDKAKAHNRGSTLFKKLHIQRRIREMQDELKSRRLWTKTDSVDFLLNIAAGLDPDSRTSDRINAIKELNTIHGFNNKVTVDHNLNDSSNQRVDKITIEVIDGTQRQGDSTSS